MFTIFNQLIIFNVRTKISVRKIILFLILVILVLIARPVGFLLYHYLEDKRTTRIQQKDYADDASHLNKTHIAKVIEVSPNIDSAILQVSSLVKEAATSGKKIAIAGAQHSMGGHTIYPDGVVLDMKPFHQMQLDTIQNLLQVGSGALWAEVIPYLDARGRSVAVMQSNNSFSVGGSISVNCHGWQPNAPPIASTVESFRLINASGELVECSRLQNKELFSSVLGGYGLFGVIIDIKLKVVPNRMYRADQHIIESRNYVKEFDKYASANPHASMMYGRINVNPDHFLEEGIISTFITDSSTKMVPLQISHFAALRRTVFRSSANSGYGKNLRWKAEKLGAALIRGKLFSRNNLLNEGVEVFQNTDTAYTDILQEYFIPRQRVAAFIDSLKKIVPAYRVDLMNITIRNVMTDHDCLLRYARTEVFGFVMLFNQSREKTAEAEMERFTQRLTDAASALSGTYYLPYRLHATREQFYKIYPMAEKFFALKRQYDPAEIFRNRFYDKYK